MIRSLYFEIKHLFQELVLFAKYPTRKATHRDIKYHWNSILNILIFHPWYCLKRGIVNVYKWFPLIWGNDCWDYFFLCDMMDKQLKEMEDFWFKQSEKERSVWAKDMDKGFRCQHRRIFKRIKWTRKYMQMWRDEYYTMKAYDKHKISFPNEPEAFEHDEKLTKYDEFGVPVLYTCKPMSEPAKVDYRVKVEKARNMDEKVFKLWLKNLEHIRRWWD